MRLIDADAFDERIRTAGGMTEEELSEDFKDGVLTTLEMLTRQPTIEPEQQKWIPVEERLPEDYEPILCWYEYFWYGDYNRKDKRCSVGYYSHKGELWGGDVSGHKFRVIAWMPLPEPPKEEKDQ